MIIDDDVAGRSPAPIHVGMMLFAGAGSLDAQRDIRNAAEKAAGSEEAPLGEAIAVAELAGWMALRSNQPADYLALALILLRRADELSQARHHRTFAFAQAMHVLDLAADMGNVEATKILAEVSDRAPEDAAEQAKILRDDWDQMVAEINTIPKGIS